MQQLKELQDLIEQIQQAQKKLHYYTEEILDYIPLPNVSPLDQILEKLDEAAEILEFKKDD